MTSNIVFGRNKKETLTMVHFFLNKTVEKTNNYVFDDNFFCSRCFAEDFKHVHTYFDTIAFSPVEFQYDHNKRAHIQ